MIQELYSFVAALMFLGVYTQLPSLDVPCTKHADCLPQNGLCGDYRGLGRQATCQCRPGQSYDMKFLRCDNNQTYKDVFIPVAVALGLPQNWRCSLESQYCWSVLPNMFFSGFFYERIEKLAHPLVGWNNLPALVEIAEFLVTWRCTKSDEVASILSGSVLDIPRYCVTCDVWCGIHGHCTENWSCRCDTGWAGARCDVPTEQPRLGTFALLDWRTCRNDDDCQGAGMICMSSVFGSHCGCSEGYVPLGIDNCIQDARLLATGVVVDKQTWKRMSVFYSAVDSRYMSYTANGVYNIFTGQRAYDLRSFNARIDTSGLHMWHCSGNVCPAPCDNGMGGPNCDECPAFAADPGCSSAPRVCADTYCNSRGICRADGAEGCFCDVGSTGQFCETLVTTQNCPIGKYGINCELSQEQCSRERCSGNGQCLSRYQGCQCNAGYGQYANCSTYDGTITMVLVDEHFTGRPVCQAGREGVFCERTIPQDDEIRVPLSGNSVSTLVLIQVIICVSYSACIVTVLNIKKRRGRKRVEHAISY